MKNPAPTPTPIPDIDALPLPNRRSSKWLSRLLLLDAATTAIALGAIFIDVESIVGSGPVLFFAGIATIIAGRKNRYPPAWAVGSAQCAICLFVFALIMIFNWSPSQAQTPVSIIAVIYTLFAAPALTYAYRHVPPQHDPYRCQTCDYPLIGLPSPRCPECATPFNPKQISDFPSREESA